MKYICRFCGFEIEDDRSWEQKQIDYFLSEDDDEDAVCPKCYHVLEPESES